MDILLSLGVGLTAMGLLGMSILVLQRWRQHMSHDARMLRTLAEARETLADVEQKREYYAATEVMLRRRVARLQKLEQAAKKVARDKQHDRAWFTSRSKTTTEG